MKPRRLLLWLLAAVACLPLAAGVAFLIEYQRFCTPWDEHPGYHVAECADIQSAGAMLAGIGVILALPLCVMLWRAVRRRTA